MEMTLTLEFESENCYPLGQGILLFRIACSCFLTIDLCVSFLGLP